MTDRKFGVTWYGASATIAATGFRFTAGATWTTTSGTRARGRADVAQVMICPECNRSFDLMDEEAAGEWYYGHDCEVPEPTLPLDRPPNVSWIGGLHCLDCRKLLILFDDDEHFCEATGTSTTFHTLAQKEG